MTARRAIALALATGCAAPAAAPTPPPVADTPPSSATTQAPTTTAAPAATAPSPPTTGAGRAVQVARAEPEVIEPNNPPEGNEGAQAQTARASWYGAESGSRTANGDAFDGSSLTYAHLRHPFGTLTRFCHEGRCVVARCNDRGPAAWTGKTFDLSRAAFAEIAPLGRGVVTVTWEAA